MSPQTFELVPCFHTFACFRLFISLLRQNNPSENGHQCRNFWNLLTAHLKEIVPKKNVQIMAELDQHCYNKGCGKTFKETENKKDSCRHHPGGPIFHDALKGWSCCKKRSCDFTEFLNIPGCTYGLHNNEKPEPPPPAEVTNDKDTASPETVITGPLDNIMPPKHRPSENAPLIPLKATVAASLKSALEKSMNNMTLDGNSDNTANGEIVPQGTCCKNSACKESYVDETTNLSSCQYHPGVPVFHEGMKYWSCCQRKTTDFDNFMAQEGCTVGRHLWIKKETESEKVACRTDWHQTAQFVTISVFAKTAVPEQTIIKTNQVVVDMNIVFQAGKSSFEKKIILKGAVDPERSSVKLLGTKVEVNLRKAGPGTWSALEAPAKEALRVVMGDEDDTEAAVASL